MTGLNEMMRAAFDLIVYCECGTRFRVSRVGLMAAELELAQ